MGENSPPYRKKPFPIKWFEDNNVEVYKVACGGLHTLVLDTKGRVYSWGCNDEGPLGRDGSEMEPGLIEIPVPVNGISAGDCHSIAYNTELNLVYYWGMYRNS